MATRTRITTPCVLPLLSLTVAVGILGFILEMIWRSANKTPVLECGLMSRACWMLRHCRSLPTPAACCLSLLPALMLWDPNPTLDRGRQPPRNPRVRPQGGTPLFICCAVVACNREAKLWNSAPLYCSLSTLASLDTNTANRDAVGHIQRKEWS